MKTIGFYGASGTGKSHRAMWLARERDIEYIIDDGLLISHNRIIAGLSAKREPTKLASVRRALFYDEKHRIMVRDAINQLDTDCIMVIGTSVAMVDKISAALELPPISEYISIEEVASGDEIEGARRIRLQRGTHVIPAPTFELKKDFSGYLIDSLRTFRPWGKGTEAGERSVVRPNYSYLGNYTISDRVLIDIICRALCDVHAIARIFRVDVSSNHQGVTVLVEVAVRHGINIPNAASRSRVLIRDTIEHHTAMNVLAVNLFIRTIMLQK